MINFYNQQYNYLNSYFKMMNRMNPTQSIFPSTSFQPFSPIMSQYKNNYIANAQQQTKMVDALYSLSSDVSNLKDSSSLLRLDNDSSSLHEREITTSNETAITASVKNGATIDKYSIQINQLAKAQQNKSVQLSATGQTNITAGVNEFSVTIGSETKNLSVSILSSDTNKDALQKIANALNESGLSLSAEVLEDNNTNEVQLQVEAANTGTDEAFSFSEVSGNVTSNTGLNNVARNGQDAEYYLNGELQTSKSNLIQLDGKKLSIELKGVTTNAETITVSPDMEQIINQTKNMVENYNKLITTFDNYADVINNDARRDFQAGLYSYYLDNTGISKSAYGRLSFNQNELERQLNDNFQDAIQSLDQIAERIHTKSNDLGSQTGETLLQKNAYERYPAYNQIYNPIFGRQMQMQPYTWFTGMMFDQYF